MQYKIRFTSFSDIKIKRKQRRRTYSSPRFPSGKLHARALERSRLSYSDTAAVIPNARAKNPWNGTPVAPSWPPAAPLGREGEEIFDGIFSV